MAILEDLGLEVEIIVDGSPLQEYEDKEQEPANDGFGDEIPKCRRYVEVNDETEFGVQLNITSNNEYLDGNEKKRLLFHIDLEGQESLERRMMSQRARPYLVEGIYEHEGGKSTVRKFRFTAVSTVDENDRERVEDDKKIAMHLGLLRVRIWRGEIGEASMQKYRCQTAGLDEAQTQLAEKALQGRALSHRATLSAAVPTAYIAIHAFKHMDPFEVPQAIFYFQHRSKAALRQELIIPGSREPSPQEIDLDGLAPGEVQRLARENLHKLPLNELRRLARVGLSSSKEENDGSSEGCVKRETGEHQINPRPRKMVKMSDGREAVDLTEDD